VTATDNIGNEGTTSLSFELHATAESLLANLDRARAEGKLTTAPNVYNGLRAKLLNARRQHDAGQHPTEWKMVEAFALELEGQLDKGVDVRTANRFIAYARHLSATGG
jgi:hypothetical protein